MNECIDDEAAEAIGCFFLFAGVIGSGVMGEALAGGRMVSLPAGGVSCIRKAAAVAGARDVVFLGYEDGELEPTLELRRDFGLVVHWANATSAALDLGGSFFLTYARTATREQVLRGYPRFEEFLRKKRQYDPGARFQSEWWKWAEGIVG